MKYYLCQTIISLVSIVKQRVYEIQEERENIEIYSKYTSKSEMKSLERNFET